MLGEVIESMAMGETITLDVPQARMRTVIAQVIEYSCSEFHLLTQADDDKLHIKKVLLRDPNRPMKDWEREEIKKLIESLDEGQTSNIPTSLSVATVIKEFGDDWEFKAGNGYIECTRLTTLSNTDVLDVVAQVLLSGESGYVPAHRFIKQIVAEVSEFTGVRYVLRGYKLTPLSR